MPIFFSLKIIEPIIFLDGKSGALELKFRSAKKKKLTKKQNKTILQFILKAAKYPVIISNVFFLGGESTRVSLWQVTPG